MKIFRFSKKLISRTIAVFTAFIMLIGSAYAAPLTQGDGNAYFYFAANGLSVEAPNNYKNGYSINGSTPSYITSNIIAHTERVDKNLLIPGSVNTITIFTGNASGAIDETLSRSQAGTGCDEFSVTVSTLCLILPNGSIVKPSQLLAYTPTDVNTPLNEAHNVAVVTKNVNLGDNNMEYAYKLEIQFDLSGVDWNTENDMVPQIPGIKNVSLEVGSDPSSRNIVWYSTSEAEGLVQLALKSDMAGDEFPDTAQTFSATAGITGLTGYISCKSTMTGLLENTEYVYRVGNDTDGWSPVYSFTTQGFDGSFSFLAVADPQLGQGNRFDNIQGEIDGWTDTLNKSKQAFPEAAFLACLGDQIAKSYVDGQYDAFFCPEALKSFALAAVPGNHDVGANYTPHFNMPNVSTLGVQSTMGAGSGDYWFTYGDALFMTINSISTAYDEHIQFLENTIEANPDAKWKIVMMHYGFFGSTTQGDTTDSIINIRQALAPVFSRLGIDVVLNGHEHAYARSYMMNAFTPDTSNGGNSVTDPDAGEVLYMTLSSASGSDYVNPKSENDLPNIAKAVQEYIPNVSKIDITDKSFTINTYRTSDMEIVDTFAIYRSDAPTVKSVSVFPKNAVVKTGLSQTFTAEVFGYNSPSKEVIWSVDGNESDATTISQTGVLTVAGDETADNVVVTAISATNSSKYARVSVTLESNITEINVGRGVTYALPDVINGVDVTQWTNDVGNNVETADTSLVGYRYYTASLADETKVRYCVNVGEYKELMRDDFEGYAEEKHTTAISKQPITGGTFTKGAYANVTESAQRITKDGTNAVAAFGNKTSAISGFQWAPADSSIGEAFKVSYKLRVASFDLDTASIGVNYFFTNNFSNTSGVQLRAYVTEKGGVRSIGNTQLYCNGTTSEAPVIDDFIEWTTPDTDNVISMKEYITVEIEGNDVQYSARVNGTEVANSVPFKGMIGTTGVNTIRWAKRNSDTVDTVTYADEMVYSKAVYVTDTLKNVPVTVTLAQGDSVAQSATAVLNMSDGTTQSFTVNFAADTSVVGVKKAAGTIDGFDGTVPVTYTVTAPTVIDRIETNEAGISQVVLRNSIALDDGARLFVAVYDTAPGVMKKICFVDLNETQRAAGEQTIILTDNLLDESDCTIKVFVWDGKLAPLASVSENMQ